jgi:hypothetical protein
MVHRELPDIDTQTISFRLRQIRLARGKTLSVIAGLAGISTSTLSEIERGERPLDSLRKLVALADALRIAPSELMKLPVPAPGNGHADAATETLRLTFDAIDVGHLTGRVLPTGIIRREVLKLQQWRRACRFEEVANELPTLIQDLHTTLKTGTDRKELLELAVYLHVHVTKLWLVHACAPADMISRCVVIAKNLADEHGGDVTVGVAQFGLADALTTRGSFAMAGVMAEAITLPSPTQANFGFVCLVTMLRALAAQHTDRPGEAADLMISAAALAGRFGKDGQVDALGFLAHPVDVGNFRVYLALEECEPDKAVAIARRLDPRRHPSVTIRTAYWMNYGRAMARLPGQEAEAVKALRTAEGMFPTMVRREPMVRDVLSSLVIKARRDAVGRELRGMAYRAGVVA